MIVTRIYVFGHGNIKPGMPDSLSGGYGIVLVENPRVVRFLDWLHLTVTRYRAVGVMVKIVVNLNIVISKLDVIGEGAAERQHTATTTDVALKGEGVDAVFNEGHGHVLVVGITDACAQQYQGTCGSDDVGYGPDFNHFSLMAAVVVIIRLGVTLFKFKVT